MILKESAFGASDVQWIFIIEKKQRKLSSSRWAFPLRVLKSFEVLILERGYSVLRNLKIPSFQKRKICLEEKTSSFLLEPLHFPERIPFTHIIFKKLNDNLLMRDIKKLLNWEKKRILIFTSPFHVRYAGFFREHMRVYYAYDDLTLTLSGEKIKGEEEAEKKLLENVDLVLCVSDVLKERIIKRMPPHSRAGVVVIPNGYDENIFKPSGIFNEPEILKNIPRPRVICAGLISERIDWDGVIKSLHHLPRFTWIFLGQLDSSVKRKIKNFHKLSSRIYFLPPVPYENLPSFLHFSDICAVPYKLNNFTLASFPLKALEYLAMGKPVISTEIPALLHHFSRVIRWVKEGSGESYASEIGSLLENANEGFKKICTEAVKDYSWGSISQRILNIILKTLNSC